jgi:hypothetical protein
MGALATISIKQTDGSYKKLTLSISDTTDKYGNNISIYEEQTKEQRDAKEKKNYLGNGKVFWTDNKITLAEKKAESPF